MELKKMAVPFLALLIALGITGVAAAWWNETLVISGTINTGTFGWDLTLEGWSKWGDEKNIVENFCVKLDDADSNGHMDTLILTADNMYPCVLIDILWDLEFYGTVPGHITDVDVEVKVDDVVVDPPAWLYLTCRLRQADITGNNPFPTIPPTVKYTFLHFVEMLESTQWHQNDRILVSLWVHLIEDGMLYDDGSEVTGVGEPPQGAKIELTITIKGYQYNFPGEGLPGPHPPPVPP